MALLKKVLSLITLVILLVFFVVLIDKIKNASTIVKVTFWLLFIATIVAVIGSAIDAFFIKDASAKEADEGAAQQSEATMSSNDIDLGWELSFDLKADGPHEDIYRCVSSNTIRIWYPDLQIRGPSWEDDEMRQHIDKAIQTEQTDNVEIRILQAPPKPKRRGSAAPVPPVRKLKKFEPPQVPVLITPQLRPPPVPEDAIPPPSGDAGIAYISAVIPTPNLRIVDNTCTRPSPRSTMSSSVLEQIKQGVPLKKCDKALHAIVRERTREESFHDRMIRHLRSRRSFIAKEHDESSDDGRLSWLSLTSK